jgi:dolichol kinase
MGKIKWKNRDKTVEGTIAFSLGLFLTLQSIAIYSNNFEISGYELLLFSTGTGKE